jgi:hypothetical protein
MLTCIKFIFVLFVIYSIVAVREENKLFRGKNND